MAIENLQEVTTWLEAQKGTEEVKNYIGGLNPLTSDGVDTFLGTEDGKKLLQPKLDVYSTKSLKSWQEDNLDKLYQERYTKENPTADPSSLEIKKLQAQLDKMQNESTHKDLTNIALKQFQEKKLPIELTDFFICDSNETTTKNIEALEKVFSAQVETIVAERLKGGYKPPVGGNGGVTYTKEQIAKMTPEEINKNWEAVSAAMKIK